MHHDTGVTQKNPGEPGEVQDALTDILRHGAYQLLTQAIETEGAEFLTQSHDVCGEASRRRLVRNGYLPPRTIQTGLGDVSVKPPRGRDRTGTIRFTSSILPPYLRGVAHGLCAQIPEGRRLPRQGQDGPARLL